MNKQKAIRIRADFIEKIEVTIKASKEIKLKISKIRIADRLWFIIENIKYIKNREIQ